MMRWLLLVLAMVTVSAEEVVPIRWRVGDTAGVTAAPGGTLKVRLVAEIEPGWHLYSLKKMEEGPIATTIGVAPGQPFEAAGTIEAPEPLSSEDANFGMVVEYYIGSAMFVMPVRVAVEAKAGSQKLGIIARYQTCNEKICLPPRKVALELPVKIEPERGR